MSNLAEVVSVVENKIQHLLKKYNFLKQENDFLIRKISDLENQLAQDKIIYSDLLEKYKSLKFAKTIEGSKEDRRETKLKINALIREVDACIQQLSE
ncbi:MAG: hypothetical protein ACWA42_10745 [Lutibacter sp.]